LLFGLRFGSIIFVMCLEGFFACIAFASWGSICGLFAHFYYVFTFTMYAFYRHVYHS
jgi:hypothetical protein